MKKKRKLLIPVIAAVLAVAVAVGGVVIWRANSAKPVDVFPVMSVYETYWGDTTPLDGTVTAGKVQTVPLRESLIESINVSVGDTVEAGDVLMVYDTTSFDLTLQMDRAQIALLESNIAIANNNLKKYRSLRPSEEMPQPTEEIIDHGPLTPRDEITEADAAGDSLSFVCDSETVVTAGFLRALRQSGKTAQFQMYDGNTLFGAWAVDGTSLPRVRYEFVAQTPAQPEEPPVEEETPEEPPVDTPAAAEETLYHRIEVEALDCDWLPGQALVFTGDGAGVDLSGKTAVYGVFTSCTPQEYQQFETVYHDNYVPDGSENYMYSKAELARMITQTEEEIASLKLDLRGAELTYQQDLLVSESGEIKATISGTVTDVMDPATLATGDALLTVKGSENYTVTAYISETNLATVALGDPLNVMAYQSGVSTTATITEIDPNPANGMYGWGNENPNNSYYPISATVDDPTVELMMGEWCEVTLMSSGEGEGGIYIPMMYVRSDSGGSYVMKADENDRLTKQYVKTGKTLWGYSIEIRGGITLEDRIAFPYGKTVQEGAPVNDLEYPEFW